MSVDQMRAAIAKVYSGIGWKEKVHYMPDYQVIAIYHNFKNRGMLDKRYTTKEKAAEKIEQLNLFDLLDNPAE